MKTFIAGLAVGVVLALVASAAAITTYSRAVTVKIKDPVDVSVDDSVATYRCEPGGDVYATAPPC